MMLLLAVLAAVESVPEAVEKWTSTTRHAAVTRIVATIRGHRCATSATAVGPRNPSTGSLVEPLRHSLWSWCNLGSPLAGPRRCRWAVSHCCHKNYRNLWLSCQTTRLPIRLSSTSLGFPRPYRYFSPNDDALMVVGEGRLAQSAT